MFLKSYLEFWELSNFVYVASEYVAVSVTSDCFLGDNGVVGCYWGLNLAVDSESEIISADLWFFIREKVRSRKKKERNIRKIEKYEMRKKLKI